MTRPGRSIYIGRRRTTIPDLVQVHCVNVKVQCVKPNAHFMAQVQAAPGPEDTPSRLVKIAQVSRLPA